MTRKKRQEHWRSVTDEQNASGLSAAAYCREHGIAPSTFRYWKKQLQADTAGEGFVQLVTAHSERTTSGIRIRVHGSVTIEVDQGFDPATLYSIVDVLCGRGMGPCSV